MALVEAAVVVLLLVGAVPLGIGLAWRVTKGFRLASANRALNATVWRQQFSWTLLAQVIVLPFMVLGTVIAHLTVIFLLIYLAAIVLNVFTILALSRGRR